MGEETTKLNVFDLFQGSQLTLTETEEKAKQEAGRPKVDRFRIGEDGEYSIRILPLAPVLDEEGNALPMERKGWEYPMHQFFLKINLPAKKGKKQKTFSIPVPRATDKGIDKSVDLIDKYVQIAKELYGDDEKLMNLIGSGSFNGGLRWSYLHALYILDLSSDKERAKGPQIWQCTNSQYSTIRDAEIRLWKELLKDGEQEQSPVVGLTNAYPINVIRTTDKKTDYRIDIARKTVDVQKEEIEKLLSLPRIPELINSFTRYQLEAEVVFLKQYDEQHQMDVCEEADFKEAVETLKGELPADDKSHFDLASAGQGKGNGSVEVTVDSLWNEYDKIAEEGLSERSDEYQELREKIRQFAEDHELDVRLSRSKNNKQLLEEVEEAYESSQRDSKKSKSKESEDESEDEKESKKFSAKEKEEDDEPEEKRPVRHRRPRPSVDDDEDEKPSKAEKEDDEPEDKDEDKPDEKEEDEPAEEERPVHRRRRR